MLTTTIRSAFPKTNALPAAETIRTITTVDPENDDVPQTGGTETRRQRWIATTTSLLIHLSLLLVLAAWLLPRRPQPQTLTITTTMGTDDGADDLLAVEPNAAESAANDSVTDRFFVVTPISTATSTELAEIKLNNPAAGMSDTGTADDGDTEGDGQGSVGFFGTQAVGKSFVFIVDCSGSMHGYRFTRACYELKRALDDLTSKQKFYIIFYNHTTIPLYLPGGRKKLFAASRRYVYGANRWIEKREAGGGTIPDQAIYMALSMKPDVIFFLSDGKFSRTARNVAREANKHGTVIHTIAFQFRGGEPVLKGIAEDNNGRYRFVE
jgi:hypothetical protein